MEDLKPREKLMLHGPKILKDEEIIAILLRTGTKDNHVLALSKQIVSLMKNIASIKNLTIEDLLSIKGISYAKATTIIASVELGRRVRHMHVPKQVNLSNTEDVYLMLREDMEFLEQEHLVVLCLDIKGHMIKKETVYIGTTTSIPLSIKDLFKSAVMIGAYGIIIVHNHPTGDSRPSLADDQLTKKIHEAGELLSVKLIDHVIVGRNEFYSYKRQRSFNI